MAQGFSYRARNLSGQVITGRIQAESSSAVVALLRSRNLFVVQIRQLRAQTALVFDLDRFFKRRIGVRTMAIFCRQFATLNNAGIPILQCLHILARQTEDRQMQKFLGDVATEIEKGNGLSEAFRKYRDRFPDIFISMIAAGELSGTLDQAMERLAVTFEREHALREKIKIGHDLPGADRSHGRDGRNLPVNLRCSDICRDLQAGGGHPAAADPHPAGGKQYHDPRLVIILPLLIVLPAVFRRLLATRPGRRAMDRLVLRLPVVGPMTTKNVVARFARNLMTLLKSGIPLVRALETVEDIVGNSVAAESIAAARENIKEGDMMSPILARSGFFPPMAVSMISVGEESGSLDTLLEKLAVFYEQEVETIVASLSSVIEPLMILGVGVLIGFIAISIYLPLFGLSGAMQAGSGVPMP